MSMELMVKAIKIKVGNPLRNLVLLELSYNANDQGECRLSYQHIADRCEMSHRSVIRHIKALEMSGFLKVNKRKSTNTDKQNASNLFTLTLEKGRKNTAQRNGQ
ncbi:MAG: helix-turn-helix domain-containing protein [Gammaproteobacteria bacterium]|nr:helix-turn-helix domain-containing protein [Gammaproteobacteria bacterium]